MKLDMEKKHNEEALIKEELENLKKREVSKSKQKKGLKKFFARSLAASPRTEGGLHSPSPKVGTIAPPSMGDAIYENLDDSSSEEGDSLANSTLFSKTSVSVAEENQTPVVETVMTEDSSCCKGPTKSKKIVAATKSAKTPSKKATAANPKPPVAPVVPKMTLAEKMRKVQSMDPRIATQTKTFSRKSAGAKLETVDTNDTEDELIAE